MAELHGNEWLSDYFLKSVFVLYFLCPDQAFLVADVYLVSFDGHLFKLPASCDFILAADVFRHTFSIALKVRQVQTSLTRGANAKHKDCNSPKWRGTFYCYYDVFRFINLIWYNQIE